MNSSTENQNDDSAATPEQDLDTPKTSSADLDAEAQDAAFETENTQGDETEIELSPEAKVEELRDEVARVRAEMQNFRRQSEKRVVDNRKFITKDIFLQILPIVDNFDAAMKALDQGQDADNVLIGVKMIHGMLGKLLSDNQINRIATEKAAFDASLHEAIGSEESDEFAPNTIIAEIQSGYRFGELVLRHARVNVSIAPSVEEE